MKTSQNFRESVSNNKLKAEKLKSSWREGEKKNRETLPSCIFKQSRNYTFNCRPKKSSEKKRKTHLKCRHGNFYTR